jgi:endo-1,4-beta-mannosidase
VRRGHLQIFNPELEWINAAHSDNLSYEDFREKPVDYQEKIIAAYRTNTQIQAVIDHDNRPKKS